MPDDTQPVEVYNPQGKFGVIPAAQVEKAKSAGYKLKSDFVEVVHPKTGQTGIIPKGQWGDDKKPGIAQVQGYVMSPREQQRSKIKAAGSAEPKAASPLEQAIDSPRGKEIRQGEVEAGKFGAEALMGKELLRAGKAFVKPSVTMVPETSKLLDAEGKPIVRYVEQAGKSAAQKAGQAVIKGVKSVPAWLKANPIKALAIEGIAHELGVDPIQLAHKVLKYGSGVLTGGTTHVP
jgi:hypothetical protein